MTFRLQVSTIALAASCAWAVPANAQDSDTAIRDELAAMRAQMAQMAARMETLQSQLDQANAKADAATTAATTASEVAQAASVSAEAAKDGGEKSGAFAKAAQWAADTKVSGRMYFNMSTVNADNAAGTNVEKDSGFEIKRFYVGVDHKFDDTFAGNVTMDISRVDNGGKNVGMGFYVKKAYLEAKLAKELKLRFGSADMPWVPYAEGINGYRHIEKELVDFYGFGTSADWGVHAAGDLADGLVSYQVSAIDGGGYRDPKLTKTIDLEGRVSVRYKGFNAGIGGYSGKLGQDVEGALPYRTATRFNALLAWKDEVGGIPVTVGGEYFTAKNWKVALAAPEDKAEGYSLFASAAPIDQWSVFGRYDRVEPNQKTAPLRKADFYMLGLQYSPAKIVDLALVWKHDDSEGGLKAGNLGTGQADRDEIGIYGQFRF